MTTARDRPPEEAAEDTSFARGLRVLLTIADRGEIRADELATTLELLDVDPLSLPAHAHRVRVRGTPRRRVRARAAAADRIRPERQQRGAHPGGRPGPPRPGRRDRRDRAHQPADRTVGDLPARDPVGARPAGRSWAPGTPARSMPGRSPESCWRTPPRRSSTRSGRAHRRPRRPDGRAAADGAGPADTRQLRADLGEIVAAGIARSAGEFISGSVAMAVPIMRKDGIVAAIGVIGPEGRCGLAWRARVAGVLPDAARTIVASLNVADRPDPTVRLSYIGTGTSRDLTIGGRRADAPASMDVLHDLAPVSEGLCEPARRRRVRLVGRARAPGHRRVVPRRVSLHPASWSR